MNSVRQASPLIMMLQTAGNRVAAGLLLVIVAACGGEPASDVPSQKWRGMDVRLESRPNPPHVGVNEFLVMVTDERGHPAYNLVVSMRTSDKNSWTQAIEDGQIGVYRRGVKVESAAGVVLQVQIRRKDAEDVLYFPLTLQP